MQTLSGHTNLINSLVYDATHNRLISGSGDKTIKVWDMANGTCIRTLSGHTDWINSLVYDATHNRLISGSDDKTIKVWDMVNGTCIQILSGHTDCINSLVYDATHNRLISGSADETIKVWQPGSYAHTLCNLAMRTIKTRKDLYNFQRSQAYIQLSFEESESIKQQIPKFE
jgi:WD40 repeat protein